MAVLGKEASSSSQLSSLGLQLAPPPDREHPYFQAYSSHPPREGLQARFLQGLAVAHGPGRAVPSSGL